MKKKLLSALVIALIISSVISISMFLLEGISAYTTGRMPIYHTVWGGEYGEDVGIGWSIGTTYPMSTPGQQVHSTVRVFPNTTIIPFFLIIWAVIFAVAFIIKGGKKALIILAVSSAGIACVTGIVIGVKRGIGGWLDKPKVLWHCRRDVRYCLRQSVLSARKAHIQAQPSLSAHPKSYPQAL